MKLVRSVFFYFILVVSTIVLGSSAIAGLYITRRNEWAHKCGRWWGKVNLWAARAKVVTRGLENIDREKAYIYAANHQGWFDIFAIYAGLPVQFRWLAKEELFKMPIFGPSLAATGAIPIDRSDRKKAFESIDQAAKKVESGTSIIIFPEGTRSPDGVLQEFKSGGFILAIKSQQPIVPISVSGSHLILPKKGTWMIDKGTIRITVGKPIPTSGLTVKDRDSLIQAVREAIRQNLPPEEAGHPKDNVPPAATEA